MWHVQYGISLGILPIPQAKNVLTAIAEKRQKGCNLLVLTFDNAIIYDLQRVIC